MGNRTSAVGLIDGVLLLLIVIEFVVIVGEVVALTGFDVAFMIVKSAE